VEYLKTFRLSRAQAKRAFLLRQLAMRHWELEATGDALGWTKDELIERFEHVGFGYLLKPDVLAAAKRRRRGGG
jgi:hypothetical protein